MIRRMREKVFYGLHYYYVEKLKLSDYACRLGKAMSVIAIAQVKVVSTPRALNCEHEL